MAGIVGIGMGGMFMQEYAFRPNKLIYIKKFNIQEFFHEEIKSCY